MELIGWFTGMVWHMLIIALAWTGIRYLMKNGSSTLKEVLLTLGTMLKVGCIRLRMKLIGELKKEQGADGSSVETEGSVE